MPPSFFGSLHFPPFFLRAVSRWKLFLIPLMCDMSATNKLAKTKADIHFLVRALFRRPPHHYHPLQRHQVLLPLPLTLDLTIAKAIIPRSATPSIHPPSTTARVLPLPAVRMRTMSLISSIARHSPALPNHHLSSLRPHHPHPRPLFLNP